MSLPLILSECSSSHPSQSVLWGLAPARVLRCLHIECCEHQTSCSSCSNDANRERVR
jgi:hypothetical protein